MKLVHVDLEKPIAIHRNCPTEWIIESPELFLKYVEQLQKQNQGEEGNFVLSKADTEPVSYTHLTLPTTERV